MKLDVRREKLERGGRGRVDDEREGEGYGKTNVGL